MPTYELTINGRRRRVTAEADTPLLWVLRDSLGMTGTKFGCGEGICGACTVHENGNAVRSCLIPISAAAAKSYVTIEGLASKQLHACQQAWLEEDVAQCGYCQPGMIMTAAALLRANPSPTDVEIDAAMANSVCRCGTYNRMRAAIRRAARGAAK
jgi:isoquinoline 1-oxidoreductase subunit alpha